MKGALGHIAALLVEPATPREPTTTLPTACRAAVVGSVTDAPPLAATLALTLRAADRRAAALVALWGAAAPPGALAVRGARRLAAAASTRATTGAAPGAETAGSSPPAGTAIARGRLAWLALPAEPVAAVDAVVAAAGMADAPLVTALAGARPPALDDLVAGHDLVVVAAPPGSLLARTAVERLSRRGVRATACRPLGRGVVRALAMAGLAVPRLELVAGQGEAL